MRKLEAKTTGKLAISDSSRNNVGPILVGILNRLHLRNMARRIRARAEYNRHHFAWYGLIPEGDYHRAFHGQQDINTYLANQTAKRAFPQWKIPEGLGIIANSAEYQE